ncbi:MAG: amylo-alpha-1,6-glucosidase [Bacteroidota bacterium]|nr:amylo-alpha-1,6-glucosidase [Bacteroidota bacterium]MDP4204376.1 amylo-alpha-1,6-glucosidase [Bacteroidota bacterium]
MSYLKFDKSQLVNLEYSLQREILRTNRAGSYSISTLARSNTRKYHGLLVCPLDELDGSKHVLLSSLDETIVQHGSSFNLGLHRYSGEHYNPKGHKYITDFEFETNSLTTYRVGGVVLTVERLLVEKKQQVLMRYTLVDAHSPTKIQFKPFLAFRSIHSLSKANLFANTKYQMVPNGIRMKLYDGYPFLNMQFSKEPAFIPVPDWYYNIEYYKEIERGYEGLEDLFVPGYFEIPIEKGESLIFSASTEEIDPLLLKRKFTSETKKKDHRDSFFNCLKIAAGQFLVKKEKQYNVVAGYPWYDGRTRQTLLSLPSLTLAFGDEKTFENVLDYLIGQMKDGLFPRTSGQFELDYDDCDSPLILFWTLQQLAAYRKETKSIWKKYGPLMKKILLGYKKGLPFNIKMLNNGLITAGDGARALTWMDGYVDEKPVTPRKGLPVEVNALWYNAICFALKLAKEYSDKEFISRWGKMPAKIEEAFVQTFWSEDRQYLADYVDGNYKDWSVRPNMVIVAALEYSPIDKEKKKAILEIAIKDLMTPRGLRSLSPRDPLYQGVAMGNERERQSAIHQGSAYPWLMGIFIIGYLSIYKKSGLSFAKQIIKGFEEEMTENCVGTISELYDGDPPHKGRGAISQAWNVAFILRSIKVIESYEK